MNPYQLIMNVQQRMQNDSVFARRFNEIVEELNNIPGLQTQVIKIAQINDEKKRQQVIEKLPKDAKHAVKGLIDLLTEYNLL